MFGLHESISVHFSDFGVSQKRGDRVSGDGHKEVAKKSLWFREQLPSIIQTSDVFKMMIPPFEVAYNHLDQAELKEDVWDVLPEIQEKFGWVVGGRLGDTLGTEGCLLPTLSLPLCELNWRTRHSETGAKNGVVWVWMKTAKRDRTCILSYILCLEALRACSMSKRGDITSQTLGLKERSGLKTVVSAKRDKENKLYM